jgi:hypothetical protein
MMCIVLLVYAIGVLFCDVSNASSQDDHVTLRVHQEQRANFLPGEPIEITVELRNLSSEPIIEPWGSDWEVSVTDTDGITMPDNAPPGQPRFWIPPHEGGSSDFSTLEPGGTITRTFALQYRFGITDEGSYTVNSRIKTFYAIEKADGTMSIGSSFVVESEPFVFQLSRQPVVWRQSVNLRFYDATEPLIFHVVRDNGNLSLRFYLGPPTDSEDPLFTDYHIVSEAVELTPTPEVTKHGDRVGVKYMTQEGMVCAIVERHEHDLQLVPPVLVGPGSECPPRR